MGISYSAFNKMLNGKRSLCPGLAMMMEAAPCGLFWYTPEAEKCNISDALLVERILNSTLPPIGII